MAIDTQTQIGADGRRYPIESTADSDAPEGAPATVDAAARAEDYEDTLSVGKGSVLAGTQIGPDGKRAPIDPDAVEEAAQRHVAGGRIDPGTQITADGSRVPRDEVDPNAPAPRFVRQAEEDGTDVPEVTEATVTVRDGKDEVELTAAEFAERQTADARDTVPPSYALGGEYEEPEAVEPVEPPAPIGNESMPTPIPAHGTTTDDDGATVPDPDPALEEQPDEGDDLTGKSKDELYEIATELEVEGRSSMSKGELADAIRAHRAGGSEE